MSSAFVAGLATSAVFVGLRNTATYQDAPRPPASKRPDPSSLRGNYMALEMFLKIDGVVGGTRNYQHKGWSDMLSWNWNLERVADNAGGD